MSAVRLKSTCVQDSNSNELLEYLETASAVNHVGVRNAATGNPPALEARGGDTNIGLNVKPKGTGTVTLLDGDGNEVLETVRVASAVNELGVRNAATGTDPAIVASGDDTNIGINLVPKGSGTVKAAGNAIYYAGGTDVPVTDGGTGSSSAAGARTNLGVPALTALDAAPAVSAGAEAGNAITVTLQATELAGGNLSARRLMRVWVADSEYGAEAASAPDGGVTIGVGTQLQQITANKHWVIISDGNGQVQINLTHSAADTFWVHAEIAGRIGTGEVTFA